MKLTHRLLAISVSIARGLFVGPRGRAPRFQPGEFRASRARLVTVAIYSAFAMLALRAAVIHLDPPDAASLQTVAQRQYTQTVELAPYRGTIFDRRKEPLAISIRVPSLFVNPRQFQPTQRQVTQIASALQVKPQHVRQVASKKTYFAWLARKTTEAAANAIAALQIEGLAKVMEPARFYPTGLAAAHVIGMVGMDDRGLMGLERQLERDLRGMPLKFAPSKDARGKTIFTQSENAIPEKTGNNVYLTIDRVIQEITEESLARWAQKARATGGFAIVSDPHTGRILALANYPQFDPNDRRSFDIEKTRNRALADTFEPGSVMKPFVIATAIEAGKTTMSATHNCENGAMRIPGAVIHDDHPKGILTTAETLIHSSNICTYKIADKIGPQRLHDAYEKFGFSTGLNAIGFPGESKGRLTDWADWRAVRFANIAFGQGMTTSGLEMVQAYGAIANGGHLTKPFLIERIESSDGATIAAASPQNVRRVISPETAREVRVALGRVVTEGTGDNARSDRYTTGGKTGTAQKVDPITRKYSTDKRVASFVGFAPIQDPHVVIYVVIDEPREKPYYGATWAAPAFREITDRTLEYLNVAPDKAPTPTVEGIATGKDQPTTDDEGTVL